MTAASRLAARCSLALLTVAAGLAGGCGSGSGGLFASEKPPLPPLKGSESIDRDAYGKLGYALDWSGFAAFDQVNNGVPHQAALLGDLLVISDDTTATSALSRSSGALKWALQVDSRAGRFNGLTRIGGLVIACNESEVCRINDETGELMSRQSLQRLGSTSPIFFGKAMVYGTGSGVVAQSLDLNDQLWGYMFPSGVTHNPVSVGGTTVCFTSRDGLVAFIDCDTGSLRGYNRMLDGAGASAVFGDGAVYVAGLDQSIWAFDAPTGQRRWQVRTESPLTVSPDFASGRVLVSVPNVGVVALSSKDGSQQWVNKTLRGRLVCVRKGNPIFFDKVTGKASLIDGARGELLAEVTLDNVSMILAEQAEDGALYTISPRGEVSRFIPR